MKELLEANDFNFWKEYCDNFKEIINKFDLSDIEHVYLPYYLKI